MTESSLPLVIFFATVEDATEPAHRSLLEASLVEHNGELVKRLADGVMAVFRVPADAVACAFAMQSSVRSEKDAPLSGLRVGLALGEAYAEEGDYFGTPVVVARRLCDIAEVGQILCNRLLTLIESVQEIARIRDLGPLDLKGLATPIAASEVLPPEPPGERGLVNGAT